MLLLTCIEIKGFDKENGYLCNVKAPLFQIQKIEGLFYFYTFTVVKSFCQNE